MNKCSGFLLSRVVVRGLFNSPSIFLARGMKRWPLPPDFNDVVFPKIRKLQIMDPVPHFSPTVKQIKWQRRLYDMQGPETVHNTLMYKQYGIMALTGGRLKPSHLQMMRNVINKHLDEKRMFAVWRVDPPWLPITRRGQGKRMGGGKGSINCYVTPVRAGRVLIEIGGTIEFEEVHFFLHSVAARLPLEAIVINQEFLSELKKLEDEKLSKNMNPLSMEYCIKNNIQDCQTYCDVYDLEWYGKYV